MLCYALYYVLVCCVMLCYTMLCYAMLCYAMPCYAMLCCAMYGYIYIYRCLLAGRNEGITLLETFLFGGSCEPMGSGWGVSDGFIELGPGPAPGPCCLPPVG